MINPLAIVLIIVVAIVIFLFRHRGLRTRIYRDLARRRKALMRGRQPHIQNTGDVQTLHFAFAREHIVRVEGFLAPESLADLRAECLASLHRAERSFIPGHKKGGTLSYEGIHRHAPACLAFYHLPQLRDWLSEIVGESLQVTADHDQSSCSILYYQQAGDHIGWHYDHNFYRGRHFTVLLSLVNQGRNGGVASGKLQNRRENREAVEWDTAENVLVLFEGEKILHQTSPIAAGDRRIMLSMTFCTDPGINPLKELVRRIKDTAFYGPRVLID